MTAPAVGPPDGSSTLRSPVDEDLEYICGALEDELRSLEGKEVLVTGGAGFLGHYLVLAALRWNAGRAAGEHISIVVADTFGRGVPDWLAKRKGDPALTLVEHDVTRPLPSELSGADYVFHAAGIASPVRYRRHPLQCIDANIDGLRSFLDHAVERRDAGRPLLGLLFFSSSEIYGDPPPEAIPTPETYRGSVSCTGPRAPYDEAKRFGETLCVTFARQEEVPVKIARPFNNYGPGLELDDGRVISDFARDVMRGSDIVMLSDGSPTRTFCYNADATIGYFKVLVKGEAGEPYNIGIDGPEISMRELAERVVSHARDLFGYDGGVVHRRPDEDAYLVDNPTRRCPSIEKARRELGYEPGIPIEEGLPRTLAWYHATGGPS